MLDFESGAYKSFAAGSDWDFDVPRYGGMALWSLAKSTKNRDAIRRAGAIPVLAKLMKTKQVSVVIPTVGILQECASEVRNWQVYILARILNQYASCPNPLIF